MHFVISWDIPTTTPNRSDFENRLVSCFSNKRYNKPLTTFYIVHADTRDEYSTILANLQNVSRSIPSIKLIISPLMAAGRYDGLLNNQTWTEINQISG